MSLSAAGGKAGLARLSLRLLIAAAIVVVATLASCIGASYLLPKDSSWGFARLSQLATALLAGGAIAIVLLLISFGTGLRAASERPHVLWWIAPMMLAILGAASAGIVAWILLPIAGDLGWLDGGKLDDFLALSSIVLAAASFLATGFWVWWLLRRRGSGC